MFKSIPVAKILADAAFQVRAGVNHEVVGDYADAMRGGATFPPLVVFEITGKLPVVDGFHRLAAAKLAGVKTIQCDVRTGSKADALKFALGANAAHGLRRTNQDKHRAAEIALREFPNVADAELARWCGVSQPFISGVRRELQPITVIGSNSGNAGNSANSTPPKRIGADGKARQLPPPRAAKPTPPPRKSQPPETLDATGIEVPPEILPLWNSAFERGQRLLTIISEARREIRAAQDSGDPVFREVDHTDIVAKLDQVYADLKRVKPYAVCPDCNGVMAKGCPTCKGRGFVSEFFWSQCVPDQKKKIRNANESEAD